MAGLLARSLISWFSRSAMVSGRLAPALAACLPASYILSFAAQPFNKEGGDGVNHAGYLLAMLVARQATAGKVRAPNSVAILLRTIHL